MSANLSPAAGRQFLQLAADSWPLNLQVTGNEYILQPAGVGWQQFENIS